MYRKKSVVFLGFSDFPYGLAEAQKIILISKCLLQEENNVSVICRNGTYIATEHPELRSEGFYENIHYKYASGSCFRNSNFVNRRLYELKGKINEVTILNKIKKEDKLDFAILSTRSFPLVIYYIALAKIMGFKIILNYVEFYPAIKKDKFQFQKKMNDLLFDKYAPALSDAVFPISEFLITNFRKNSPQKPYLKIPGLTDFARYENIKSIKSEQYFLFCGYAGYKETIFFIIDSFELIPNNSFFLYLIINGSKNDLQEIKDYIESKQKKGMIKRFSMLSQTDLFTYYKNAAALLIPLRPSLQDIARFPHKIGEYMASGNPVISTNYGEVKYYFQDMKNMLIAEEYDLKKFAEKMQQVINNPEKAREIGLCGKEVARKLFDYRHKAAEIDEFLNSFFKIQTKPRKN